MYDSPELMGVDRVRRMLDFDGAATEIARRDVLLWGGPSHGRVVQPGDPTLPIELYHHKGKICTCALCLAAATRYVYRPQRYTLAVGQLGWVATVASCGDDPPVAGAFYGAAAAEFFRSRPWRVTRVLPRYRTVGGRIQFESNFEEWWAVRSLRDGRHDELANEWLRVAAHSLTQLSIGVTLGGLGNGVKLSSPIVAIGSLTC